MSLREAYELIKDEEHWTAGRLARTKHEAPVSPVSPVADRWCAMGAMYKTSGVDPNTRSNQQIDPEELEALNRSAAALFPQQSTTEGSSIVLVNDNEGHAAVLQCFEKALVEIEGGL